MTIFKGNFGNFVVSSGGVWLPGVYEDERAANYAYRFSSEDLHKLQDEVNEKEPDHEKRFITFEMLQKLRRARNDRAGKTPEPEQVTSQRHG